MKYFLHDTSSFDDEKITELFLEFGYEGLGLFYTVLEKIAKQEKPVKTIVLKSQLKVGKRLDKCWSYMEEIGILSSSNGETFNSQLLNFSGKYQIKKENTRKRVSEWRERQAIENNVTGYVPESNPDKGNESKINKNEETPEKSSGVGLPDFIDQIVNEFVQEHGDYVIVNKGKERIAASKLLELYKKQYSQATSEETLLGLRAFFRSCINIKEPWLNNNMSLPLIVSKFNEIKKYLKHGKVKGVGATDRELAELFTRKFAENRQQPQQ